MNAEEEVEEIRRLGQPQQDGSFQDRRVIVPDGPAIRFYIQQVTFGVLFNDDTCANIFEALVGTLRAAKKRKVVKYDGELLLQGVHDNVLITLLPAAVATAAT